ncbi:MAG TPA: KUP/HAK/KT family potassium transporter [Candidatus Eremiobacteraeota bacterium]|nr:KUP/HAK/KT family potassium transporter [Candidatus Eremiobacteraeota bacterium]
MNEINRVIKSLGIVFGDIGTSPIYTLTAIFLIIHPTEKNIMGVLSLIFWTLTILVSMEYAWLAMSLGRKGEGGTIVLKEILVSKLKSTRQIAFITFLTFIGVSLLIGDGVITPAITILSAVEGILLIPKFSKTTQITLILVAAVIAIALFTFQKNGTEKIGKFFGPLMLLWFASLAISGIISLSGNLRIIMALNPYYAITFFFHNGLEGFFVLSEVILCATGGEALYADMGHLGRKPIIHAWYYFVFPALVFNYLGQGAFLMHHPDTKIVLFGMLYNESGLLYIPFLIMSIIASVIASQSMISGMFSIVYQGITTHIMPLFKVDYTSAEMSSQIYIGFVNWFLLICVLFIMFIFKESSKLAAAYGLAVTGTMSLTGIMLIWIFYMKKSYMKSLISLVITVINFTFLLSNTYKIPHGGYWSIIIALLPLCLILIYTQGQRKLYLSLKSIPLATFLEKYNEAYKTLNKISGSALFFARDINKIPPYIARTMFIHNIIYEDNIIVSMARQEEPFGVSFDFKEKIADGLRVFEIRTGYMEIIEVEEILKKVSIEEKAIFYGLEDINTENIIWKIFAAIKNLTPSFVQFYKLPPHKLHGVITRLEI